MENHSLGRDDSIILTCFACGKSFTQQNALTNHTRTCSKGRKRIASAQSKAKDAYFEREREKKKRREMAQEQGPIPSQLGPEEASPELQVARGMSEMADVESAMPEVSIMLLVNF